MESLTAARDAANSSRTSVRQSTDSSCTFTPYSIQSPTKTNSVILLAGPCKLWLAGSRYIVEPPDDF